MVKSSQDAVKDPVCQMWVPQDRHAIQYLGMDYAFCSQQCKDRFLANPHLYVGVPGEEAPRHTGQEVIKRRRLQLDTPLSDTAARQVIEHLLAMMGVYAVDVDGVHVSITYDLLQATAEQIEGALQQAGAHLGAGWSQSLRRAFVHYLEETEMASLEARSDAHEHGGSHHHE